MRLFCEDCRQALRRIPAGSVDLVVMDPPYELDNLGGGAFGSSNRAYHGELTAMSDGIDPELLELIASRQRAVNCYVWCNKRQLRQYLDFFEDRGANIDLLAWHKTNPVPTCCNKYLSDTEYVVFARDPGVKLYGTYETKRKYWVTAANRRDKELYSHPTVKPLDIVEMLVTNSSLPGQTVLDPFMGSGTTGVACVRSGREFVGMELDEGHYATACRRIEEAGRKASAPGLDAYAEADA